MRYSASRAASAIRAVDLDGDVLDRADERPSAARAPSMTGAMWMRAQRSMPASTRTSSEARAPSARARRNSATSALAVVGRDALEPRRAVEDLAGQAEDLAQALVGVGQAAVLGDGEDADGRRAASVRKRSSLSASACSAARRSPMSAICERKYWGAPSALRTTVTSSATHASPPSARR